MAGNSFGRIFQITTFGESHGEAIGVVVDGCPAGMEITREEIQSELDRRKPGTSTLVSSRGETDQVEILSGIFEGKTLGTPIAMIIRNHDTIAAHYKEIKDLYRPGHADYTYDAKYGVRDWRGGGRASARETGARVAAGALAKKLLATSGIHIFGFTRQIGSVITPIDATQMSDQDKAFIETNPLRCPDPATLQAMTDEVESARKSLDSVGGIIEIIAKNIPAGLGEPVFHKLSADLAHAMFTIPAVKGFEVGDGFAVASRRASANNDSLTPTPPTNHAGGIIGGISNGQDIVIRIALKPPSSIAQPQQTIDTSGNPQTIEVHGRHDPCVCPRAIPIAESMMALVLADHLLQNRTSRL